jgi:hypothetical protein
VSSSRRVRIAWNEIRFRATKERTAAAPERHDLRAATEFTFYCECGDPECNERMF